MIGLAGLVDMLFTFYYLLIFGRIMLSWIRISPYHPVAELVVRLTEPVLAPIRNMMPQSGMFDFSPMIAIILLTVLQQIVRMFLFSF